MAVYALFEVIVAPEPSAEAAERYAAYRAAVPGLIERYGGRYLARAAAPELIEGAPSPGHWHIVEFPDAESAHAFWESDDYRAIKPLRYGAADARTVLIDPGEAAADDAALLVAARAVKANAHVPYSGFHVGAAILTTSGRVFTGCNYENAAYPQGVCAEGSAIAAMVSAGEYEIDTIVTACDIDTLPTPCGGCRQKIREFATPRTMIRCAGPSGFVKTYTIDELLPDSFGPEQLAAAEPDRPRGD